MRIVVVAALLVASCGAAVAAPRSPLKRVGDCTITTIAEIGSRLEGAPDSGVSISYANGVYGVSYESVQAIKRSRTGDRVRLCLRSLPTGCPKGDERGKVYEARNRRNGLRWSLPDAQHMCGGA